MEFSTAGLTSPLCGEIIKDHYDHELIVADYGCGKNYSLEYADCCEVLCDSENPRSTVYKALKELYRRQSQQDNNFKIFFSRIGGRYGSLCWTDDDNEEAVKVLRTRSLV